MPRQTKPAAPATTRAARAGDVIDQGLLLGLVGYNLRRAYLGIIHTFHERMAKHALRPAEFSLLAIVAANEGVTPKKLALALDIAPPNLVALIERLRERGLIDRESHPHDRRSQVIVLTASGRRLLTRAEKTAMTLERDATAALDEDERAQLLRLLQRIYLPGDAPAGVSGSASDTSGA